MQDSDTILRVDIASAPACACPGVLHLKLAPCIQTGCVPLAAGIDLLPTEVYQNNRKCILVRNGLSASAFDEQRTPFESTGRPVRPIKLSGPNIIGVDGEVLAMKGINWFGFDVSNLSPACVPSDLNFAGQTTCFIVLQ